MKKTVLLITTAFITTVTLAQPRIKHQGVIGRDKNDIFSSMYLTKDGGLIVAGTTDYPLPDQKVPSSQDGSDYWIIKLDSNRNIQWNKTIGGSKDDGLNSIQQTADGGYILGGYSSSDISGDKTENHKGFSDYWIVKLDSAGNIQWDKTIGGSNWDYLKVIQQTTDSGYILGGQSFSNTSGDKTQDCRGAYDYWIVKVDATGNIQWDKTIGGNSDDELYATQQTTDGGYILGGDSWSDISGEKTQNTNDYYPDYWVVKIDAAGNIQWDKTIGGTAHEEFGTLQQTADGGYILGGESMSGRSGDKTQFGRGWFDYWIVKLDAAGSIQWDKTIGGSDGDYLRALQQTTDGGYILGGFSYSNISREKTENSRGSNDYWVVKVNSRGNVQWDKTIGGSEDDGFWTMKILETKRNHYIVGGSSLSGISGDKTKDNRGTVGGTYDYWLVELRYVKPDSVAITQVPTSRLTAPQQKNNATFSVYPNPATTLLHIQNSDKKATFILSDQSGKKLLTKTLKGSGNINVSHLPTGTYYLTNTTTGITQKVVITK